MQVLQGKTADDVWRAAATQLLDPNTRKLQPGRGGATQELLHVALLIENPRQRWVLSRWPALNPAFALLEIIWLLAGRNDAQMLNHWNTSLPKYAGEASTYHGAYGFRLRRHFGPDQLERAYQALRHNPASRQVVLQIWDPREDLPHEDGTSASPDIPCNLCSLLKVRDGRLEWLQVMRSNDIYRGLPYNFVQFTALQEIMAGWLGLELGSYTHISDSLHVYERDLAQLEVAPQSAPPVFGNDVLSLPKQESERVIAELSERLDRIVNGTVSPGSAFKLVADGDIPEAYRNILRIIVADACRRNRWYDEAARLIADCSSSVLQELWNAWIDRVER